MSEKTYCKHRKSFAASQCFMEMTTYFTVNDTISRKQDFSFL